MFNPFLGSSAVAPFDGSQPPTAPCPQAEGPQTTNTGMLAGGGWTASSIAFGHCSLPGQGVVR